MCVIKTISLRHYAQFPSNATRALQPLSIFDATEASDATLCNVPIADVQATQRPKRSIDERGVCRVDPKIGTIFIRLNFVKC